LPDLNVIIVLFVVLILSLSFHEAAHAWTADKLGDPTARHLGRLTLNPLSHIDWIGTVLFPLIAIFSGLPLLGWAKPVPVNPHNLRAPRRDFAIVALAGPVSNIILAVGAATILKTLMAADMAPLSLGIMVLARTVSLNVLLAVFNLLPVPPLDGGNVLKGLVPEGVARALDALAPFGFLILYALMFSGVLGSLLFPIYDEILRWLR
jgi:Zn-dependent protease